MFKIFVLLDSMLFQTMFLVYIVMITIISFTESSCNCIMGLIIYSIEGKWKYCISQQVPFKMEHFFEESATLRFEFLTLLIWVNVLITEQFLEENVPLYKEPAKRRHALSKSFIFLKINYVVISIVLGKSIQMSIETGSEMSLQFG